MIRLLHSLQKADLFSSAPPRLTIELPHDIDAPTSSFLQSFQWPPSTELNTGNLLTLHHRIPQHGLTREENDIRVLESFWPADRSASHVLILSPQVELSPLFYHYLKYTLLEYKYSLSKALINPHLLGISLELPTMFLNETSAFTPPLMNGSKSDALGTNVVTPFLWQAPNSNAALYFGEKWTELHEFVTNLLQSQHTLPTATTLNGENVSHKYPSWLEHILKLARARGYWFIYPNFDNGDSIATLHDDLYQPPEEFKEENAEKATEDDVLTADPIHHIKPKSDQNKLLKTSLLNILPFDGILPNVFNMPLVTWDGEEIEAADIRPLAAEYSAIFRREIGGCDEELKLEPFTAMGVSDLFCLDPAGV